MHHIGVLIHRASNASILLFLYVFYLLLDNMSHHISLRKSCNSFVSFLESLYEKHKFCLFDIVLFLPMCKVSNKLLNIEQFVCL